MEATDKNIAWAIGKLDVLKSMPGFPVDGRILRMVAKGFLAIVGPIEGNNPERAPRVDEDAPVRVLIPGRSAETQADWLIEQIVSMSCTKFPWPLEMRKIYEQAWRPDDGILSAQLTGGGTYADKIDRDVSRGG